MRKVYGQIILLTLLLGIALIGLTGCGNDNNTSKLDHKINVADDTTELVLEDSTDVGSTEKKTTTAPTTTTEDSGVSEFAQHVYDEYYYDVNGQDFFQLYDFLENGEYIHYEFDKQGQPQREMDRGTYTLDEKKKTLTMIFEHDSQVWYYQEDLGGFRTELVYSEGNTEDGPGYHPAGYYAFVIIPAGKGEFNTDYFFEEREKYVPSPYNTTQEQTEITTEITTEIESERTNVIENISNTAITSEQALQSVVNYCCEQNPALKEMLSEANEEYTLYWTIGQLENDVYTVEYRAYTGAHIYYHVNVETGDVTTTEFVPGITDGEVPGNEHFNAWDYI